MPGAITDKLNRVTDSTNVRPVVADLAGSGYTAGATSIVINDATGWTTSSAIFFSMYETMTIGGVQVKNSTTQTDWKGTLSGTTISNLTLTGGTDRDYSAGAKVEITPTARWAKEMYDILTGVLNQDGTLKAAPIQAALNLGAGSLNGWNALGYTPNTVTYNGNRSYDLVFNSVDLTGTLSNGTRLRATRTTTAPTQCTSLNGTSQYYSKSSPAGMTFTDDFVVSAWVKLSSYPASGGAIASRANASGGWDLSITSSGQVQLLGRNAGLTNYRGVLSYQSIPLNKWVHIAAQNDMSTFTATTTTSYVMIDGVDVPASVIQGGTNPTTLTQSGNLEIGAYNAGTAPFPGKIAQVAIYSAKVTQATMRGYMSQGLAGTETSLISAYSFNNSITDLNTTNANNLTANGSAVATTVDSPFAQGSNNVSGFTAGKEELGIVMANSFSTNTTVTVEVPEGSALPTSGTISAVYYSGDGVPYGFPKATDKWRIESIIAYNVAIGVAGLSTDYDSNFRLTIPIGKHRVGLQGIYIFTSSTTGTGNTNDGKVFVAVTGAATNRIRKLTLRGQNGNTAQTTAAWMSGLITDNIDLSVATQYSMWYNQIQYTGGAAGFQILGADGDVCLFTENAYL